MAITTSSEFVKLCRAQVSITASLGASLSVVYLTEELVDGEANKLTPLVTYPETAIEWQDHQGLLLLPEDAKTVSIPLLLSADRSLSLKETVSSVEVETLIDAEFDPDKSSEEDSSWQTSRQVVLPLVHEGVVMGFLVTGREDRPWNQQEQRQIQAIAHTLTNACILDQRSQWFRQQIAQYQQLQSQQNDTLHTLLHQIKSPLTALRTFGKLLIKRLLPGDQNQPIATSILRESDRIQELLEQVGHTLESHEDRLNFGMPSTVNVNLSAPLPSNASSLALLPASAPSEIIDLATVLEPLLMSAKAIAQERQLNCQTQIPQNLPPIQGNAKALREVLSNLIDNALKYTPSGGKIYIRVKAHAFNNALGLAIAISDTGPGIPPEDLKNLFQRHYRGVQAQSDIPGTGLGLVIAQDLIHEMHGEIQVFSPLNPRWVPKNFLNHHSSAVGTTFLVELPVILPTEG